MQALRSVVANILNHDDNHIQGPNFTCEASKGDWWASSFLHMVVSVKLRDYTHYVDMSCIILAKGLYN